MGWNAIWGRTVLLGLHYGRRVQLGLLGVTATLPRTPQPPLVTYFIMLQNINSCQFENLFSVFSFQIISTKEIQCFT